MYRFILFLIVFPALLLADESPLPTENEILESTHTPLTSIYGVPSTNIFGVNVINGDYHYSCVDFDLPGSDRLILQRSYCSSRFHCGGFWQGWSHNISGAVMSYASECNNFFHIITRGSLSGEIPFRTAIENKHEPLKISRGILKKGVTNCGKGEISGRTSVKNIRATYSEDGVHVKNGDGTENWYRNVKSIGHQFKNYLSSTKIPNGLKRTYESRGCIQGNRMKKFIDVIRV